MSTDDFEAAMQKCLEKIDELPPERRVQLLDLVAETRARHQRVQRSIRQAADALDDWRLYKKYSVFDQEARLREIQEKHPGRNADEQN